jgi:hypothetical protein
LGYSPLSFYFLFPFSYSFIIKNSRCKGKAKAAEGGFPCGSKMLVYAAQFANSKSAKLAFMRSVVE